MQQYQPLDFFNFDGFQPDSVVENKRANQTKLISLDSKRREIRFNLIGLIKHRDDWDSAYYMAKVIIDRSPDKQHSTLIKVASKMLLSGALLFAFSTLYPDILTVRSLIKLPSLGSRLFDASCAPSPYAMEIEYGEALMYFVECPSHQHEAIITHCCSAIDSVLNDIDLNFTAQDFSSRSLYLERVLPLIDFDNN